MRLALFGGVLLLACATSEGVGVPSSGTGGVATGGAGGTVVMGGASGSAGWPAGGTAGSSGSASGGGGSGGSGGSGGIPACAIQGCSSGGESMAGCTDARTIGRKTASVSPYFANSASTCSSGNASTDYDKTNCWDFGRDHVYRIFLRKGDAIDVSVTEGAKCSLATSWNRVFKIYGSSSCTDTSCSAKRFCAPMGAGTYSKVYTAVADGWHFLVVDGRTDTTASDDSGSYSITVKLTCAVSGCEC